MKTTFCRIVAVNAFYQTEKDGDEIFLRVNEKKIWPTDQSYIKMDNTVAKVNTSIELSQLGETVEVELWEYDHILSSERIGKFVLTADKKGGPYRTDLTLQSDSYSRYTLEWEVIQK